MPTATAAQASSIMDAERRCRDQFDWACANVLYIRPKEQPLMRLALNWPQRYVYEHHLKPAWEKREALALLVLKTRRVGMTTEFAAWLYHKIRWYRGQNCYMVANDDPTLAEIFQMVHRFHEHLPEDFMPPVDRKNTEQLSYSPPWDSSIRARIAKYGEVGRGTTLHHVLLDEIAFYPDPATILLGVLDAVPRTSASSLIMSSTANGAETWFEAVWDEFSRTPQGEEGFGGRKWQTVFLAWYMNPYNRIPVRSISTLSDEEGALVEAYHLTREQVAWRRATIREYERLFPGVGKRKFQQENPSSVQEAFILAGDCIFPEDCLAHLKRQERPPSHAYSLHQTGTWKHTMLEVKDMSTRDLTRGTVVVWEPPRRGYQYALGVDVGLGVGGDDSAVVVLRYPGFVQVACYNDNVTAPKQYAYLVGAIADWYGRGSQDYPIVTVELNNAGILVNTELDSMQGEYQLRQFRWSYWDKVGGSQQSTKTGWLTTHQTKHLLVGVANSLLMAKAVTVPSRDVRIDMERTYEIKPGVYRTKGADLCMAWLLALATCYREFARFDWPELGRRDRKAPDLPSGDHLADEAEDEPWTEYDDPTKYDKTWQKLMRRRSGESLGVDFGEMVRV